MGLLQPVSIAITQIIEQVNSPYYQSELYNILGDLYWITGKINLAISCQEKTIAIAMQCLKLLDLNEKTKHDFYYLKMLEVDSLLSIGLYKIDLWELPEAASFFQRIIEQTANTDHYRWGQKASVCLAFVNSYLGLKQEAISSADRIYDAIVNERLFEHSGRFAYFMQILGQTYINLNESEKALEMFTKAIAFSEESHYLQVKGKALTSLAELERKNNNKNLALTYHLEAVEVLEKIGAKCDLAEAYFQLSITYKSLESIHQYQKNFERAIQLFTEIEAPKQVEKIKIKTYL
jgi:tetratricopeptide (TPR) repeat protein